MSPAQSFPRSVTAGDRNGLTGRNPNRAERGNRTARVGVGWTALAAGLLLAVGGVCAGCAAAGSTAGATSSAAGAASSADVDLAAVQQQALLDPAAPPSPAPVARDGKAAGPRVQAATGGLSATKPVSYPDGVSVTVDRIRRGAEAGDGPGEFRGRQYTALALSLTNGSAAAIDLNQVVVTASYGTPARIAAPVYDDDAVDFSGTVPAGGTATATYLFAIPPQGTAQVAVSVDFDGDHVAAGFSGAIN